VAGRGSRKNLNANLNRERRQFITNRTSHTQDNKPENVGRKPVTHWHRTWPQARLGEGEEEGEGEELEREEGERGGPWIGRGQEGRRPGRDVGRARKKARYSGYERGPDSDQCYPARDPSHHPSHDSHGSMHHSLSIFQGRGFVGEMLKLCQGRYAAAAESESESTRNFKLNDLNPACGPAAGCHGGSDS
jgi:hypothetical protein